MKNLDKLVNELCKCPNETQWLEFKHNNYDPWMIGKDISALANSAVLCERNCAYMLWGIEDKTHKIIGTKFNFQNLKKGNQELESWLRTSLSQNADFEFQTTTVNGTDIGILTINKAVGHTVMFDKVDYIRVGSYTKKLSDYPVLQAQLWDKIRNECFEKQNAKTDLTLSQALSFLDYGAYFDLKKVPQPDDNKKVAHYMEQEGIIAKLDNGMYAVTNLGAILFARHLEDFTHIERKAIRIIQYQGDNRLNILKDYTVDKGYAAGFEDLIRYIDALIPTKETIIDGLREKQSTYPPIAIREAVANALIHQDFSIKGTRPIVEVFERRLEITNPGIPLIDVQRIIDNPPKSRNENLASLMRRLRICEELGTGWDKIILTCEMIQLPAPKIEIYESSTRVTIFSERPFSTLSSDEKLWSCYLHACIKQVQGEYLTNKSLRERFGLKETAAASVSRLIRESVEQNLIKPLDPETAPRYMKYIPYWA